MAKHHHKEVMKHMEKAAHHHEKAKEAMKHMDMKEDKKMIKREVKKDCMKK